jgi:hypothetical protein
VVFVGTAPLLVLLSLWWRSGKTFYQGRRSDLNT